jgi:hypothetical protein
MVAQIADVAGEEAYRTNTVPQARTRLIGTRTTRLTNLGCASSLGASAPAWVWVAVQVANGVVISLGSLARSA